MPILIAILLGLSALLIVIFPLLGLDSPAAKSAASEGALTDVAERERSAKLALRDVDFDYRLGNLDENDYDALRSRYEDRALAALRTRYEREQALDRLIDEQVAALQNKRGGKNGNSVSPSPRGEREPGSEVSPPLLAKKSPHQSENAATFGHFRPAGPARTRRRRKEV